MKSKDYKKKKRDFENDCGTLGMKCHEVTSL